MSSVGDGICTSGSSAMLLTTHSRFSRLEELFVIRF